MKGAAVPGLVLLGCVACHAAPAGWAGHYAYTETHKGPEGTGIVISHEIEIERRGGKLAATLTSEGYQNPGTTLLCDVRESPGRATLLFRSYPGGKRVNVSGVAVYRPGEKLLTLARDPKKAGRILTFWHAYTPAAGKAPDGRVYFRRP